MGSVTLRTSQTSKGTHMFTSWSDARCTYSIAMVNLGSNPISKLEIVSALNSANLGDYMFYYNSGYFLSKFNLKYYLGTIQTASVEWNFDYDSARKGELGGTQKSGS